ncbi:fumarylacetoacetate hydrolase family protein [Bosea sp. TND4EK4]|uniref:fumarylacetoacetate hydrolase family protein n=1 Tax=Bosea sp. TND4EK4 TaxID=1907408 RepID=UPI00095706A1|nr:fumarylacetoacetate hydrolase family protein [Bosea sp. TND4EK4]SIP99139.1 fumarylacetoacetate (FAA) hydrolase [Bosea sp. TND4EK4]
MKLASLAHGRDGRLVVVSKDLTRATDAFPVVATLQAALDDWERLAPRLADLAEGLEHGSVPSFRFHEHDCAAPLPRAYRRLVREGEGALTEAAGDLSVGPRQPARLGAEEGSDSSAGIAVITGEVAMAASAGEAFGAIRLVMLTCHVKQMNQDASRSAQAAGTTRSVAPMTLSPVAVTPDELGAAWVDGGKALAVNLQRNGALTPVPVPMAIGGLLAGAAGSRPLSAGTVVEVFPASPTTTTLRFGDTIRVAMKDADGHSIFGAIEQEILPEA